MTQLTAYQKELINVLVESKALTFGQFTLKSGRTSPYFFNMGRAVSNGMYLSTVSKSYCAKLIDTIGNDFSFIYGPAYKGIPLACAMAHTLWKEYDIAVRWGYDRKEAKDYGDARDKVLVGELCDNDRVIMIDDVITTGDTKVDAWKKILTVNDSIAPAGIIVAVDRQETDSQGRVPQNVIGDAGLSLHSIVTATDIFEYLHEEKVSGKWIIDDDLYEKYKKYKEEYGVKI